MTENFCIGANLSYYSNSYQKAIKNLMTTESYSIVGKLYKQNFW